VEWICETSAIMAGTEHGYIIGILLHIVECNLPSHFHAGFSGTSMFDLAEEAQLDTDADAILGTLMVVLQLCLRFVDVFDHGQRGREAGTTNWNIKWTWGTV
jgi:hypothetical protein